MNTTRQRYGSVHGQGRKGWRTFLRPGWVFMILAIIAFSYAAFSFLAPWQLSKDDDIVHRNEQVDAAFRVDPVPATEIFGAGGAVAPEDEWRRVILEGRYLTDDEVLLRLRPVDSSPAFHALTPFRLESGETILVNRGFTVPLDGNVPDMTDAPTGQVTIVGQARLNEQVPGSLPMTDQGYRQVYGINTRQISEVVGVDLGRDFVQLSADQPGVLNPIPVPKLDRGSHLSYGFQWIAFGIMAPLGLGYFVWAELRERRRVRSEEEELIDTPGEVPAAPDSGRDRYGDSRPDHYGRLAKRDRERF
ncbi:SURF1 family cytochrome oxidase biogenesis protein [Corynebacterium comes]|uniref:SURF1-like protein n=1 Tax=Corynebacterium comes TaxID=2675218 RepID=A0A6B8VY51_9CORY|nr:SURF1 family protein [Corynebacterium comes]QGU05091.1 SURF1 family protein [Corynebacterium comes]